MVEIHGPHGGVERAGGRLLALAVTGTLLILLACVGCVGAAAGETTNVSTPDSASSMGVMLSPTVGGTASRPLPSVPSGTATPAPTAAPARPPSTPPTPGTLPATYMPTPPPTGLPPVTVPPPTATVPPPSPAPRTLRSPDGRFNAGVTAEELFVDDSQGGRAFRQQPGTSGAPEVWRWTTDSRFAIFRYRHPKGETRTWVFDTRAWSLVVQTPGCPMVNSGGTLYWESCGEYPLALAPGAPLLLLENGRLADLPGFQQTDLLAPWRQGDRKVEVQYADWSPDGACLALAANTGTDPYYSALYLARGDGTQVRQVAVLGEWARGLSWAADSRTVTIEASEHRFVLDAETGVVQTQ